jgi:hypothetical protein
MKVVEKTINFAPQRGKRTPFALALFSCGLVGNLVAASAISLTPGS